MHNGRNDINTWTQDKTEPEENANIWSYSAQTQQYAVIISNRADFFFNVQEKESLF